VLDTVKRSTEAAGPDATPITGEQRRLVKEWLRAGFRVSARFSHAEAAELSARLRRFDQLSTREQEAELNRPDSPGSATCGSTTVSA
jgi:hypothetical protein